MIRNMKNISKYRINDLKEILFQNLPWISFILIISIIFFINPRYLSLYNIKNILSEIAPLLVGSIGLTFVIIIGSIDLSVGAIASAAAVCFAKLIFNFGYLAYFIVLLFGAVVGILNGIAFTKTKIPSFILTLGTMSILTSFSLILSNSAALSIGNNAKNYINWAEIYIFNLIPLQLLIAIFLLLIAYFIQNYTSFGRRLFAIGSNEKVTFISGINVDQVKIFIFTFCGICAVFMGIFLATKLRSGSPTVGDPFVLLIIAAVVMGGNAAGEGSVFRTLLGVSLTAILHNGLVVLGIDAFYQDIVFGIIIIIAIYLTVDKKQGLIIK